MTGLIVLLILLSCASDLLTLALIRNHERRIQELEHD